MNRPWTTAVFTALTVAAIAPAQVSPYVVMAGDQSNFHVIQGGVVVRSWSTPAGTARYQYPLAVTSTIRTMGANAGEIGGEYDLNGNDLGPRYTHPAGPARCWDGTTDGVSFYAIDSAGLVHQFDQTWGNPTLLFDAGGLGSLTYDPANSSLWVSQFSTDTIVEYTLAGVQLRSFTTGHTHNMALALDHADGTLWLHDRNRQGTFEQWSRTGTLLNTITPPGMSTENALGGEMPFLGSARCTFRNGNGINPPDFMCATLPVLGTNWVTSFNSGTFTTATVLLFGLGGPATGPAFFNGEFLVALNPAPFGFAGNGNISFPIPNQQSLVGLAIPTQGIRVDAPASGLQINLLNAQDIVLGR